jgi:hypothetical protein
LMALDEEVSTETEAPSVRDSLTAVVEPEAPVAEVEQELEDRIPAPKSWSRDAKGYQVWESLPREIQEQVYKREIDRDTATNQRLKELSERQKYYQSLEQVLEPRQQMFKARGIDPARAIDQMLSLYDMAAKDRTRAAEFLIKDWGVNPNDVFKPQAQVDPRIAQLEAQLQQVTGLLSQQQVAAQREVITSIERDMENFVNAKDSNGRPQYPHLEALGPVMEPILKHLVSSNPTAPVSALMKQAYEQAYWATPEFREKELQSRNGSNVPRPAKIGVSGGPGGATATATPTDLRAAISAALDAA